MNVLRLIDQAIENPEGDNSALTELLTGAFEIRKERNMEQRIKALEERIESLERHIDEVCDELQAHIDTKEEE